MRVLPAILARITHQCDAWIVGSAADPGVLDPRDYDVLVPYHMWHNAAAMLPESVANSFRGWKFTDVESGKSVDVWPGDLSWLAQRPMFSWAWHPLSDVRIRKA